MKTINFKSFFAGVKVFLTSGLLLIALCSCGCVIPDEETPPADGVITLMTWNIHNLFDGEDNGYEYDEFLSSSGWSVEKYIGRLNSFASAISRIDPLPDVIMFQEIESAAVLEDLAYYLQAGYTRSFFSKNPGAATGLGLISRLPILEAKAHSITVDDDSIPRPVVEARLHPDRNRQDIDLDCEEAFVVFVCHWKSKIGGDAATERVRRASARVILRRIRELQETNPMLGVIVAGDLNLNHDEFYRQNASIICSLLPDDPYSAQVTGGIQKDFIVISRNKPPIPVHFPKDTIALFSPWLRELEDGTYYYRNNWETIDHFLLSNHFFTNSGWDYEKAFVINFEPFANASGIPIRYNPRTGLGLSDHLPLLVTLNKIKE